MVLLNEARTYLLWESAGKKIVEAHLTKTQIQSIFSNIEQGVTDSGSNRTFVGKGKDALGAVNTAWNDLKSKVYNSGPMKGFADAYDKAAEKLKQATGGDKGAMRYVQKYRDFAEKHPIMQGFLYSALIAAAGISGAGVGGAAALGLFKLTDQLLQGKDIRSALWSATKTGAMAYGASKLGDLSKSKPSEVNPGMEFKHDVHQIKTDQGTNDVVDYVGKMASTSTNPGVKRLANWAVDNFDLSKFDYVPKEGSVYIYDKTGQLVGSLATDNNLRKAGIITGKDMLELMKKSAGVRESTDKNEKPDQEIMEWLKRLNNIV